ncbi:hypothetical protein [Thermococcus thermotolerans]|uniref:hypothetical protein n=1 Tax=Thermococcus thermotolerans TaxID=2969672 RepID=UPI00215706CE|nr:hypothetical protein [Thermococcus thermotolerans]
MSLKWKIVGHVSLFYVAFVGFIYIYSKIVSAFPDLYQGVSPKDILFFGFLFALAVNILVFAGYRRSPSRTNRKSGPYRYEEEVIEVYEPEDDWFKPLDDFDHQVRKLNQDFSKFAKADLTKRRRRKKDDDWFASMRDFKF